MLLFAVALLLAGICLSHAATSDDATPPVKVAINPIIAGNMPDPDVLRVTKPDGSVVFVLTHTVGDGLDIRQYNTQRGKRICKVLMLTFTLARFCPAAIFTSINLVDWTLHTHAFGITPTPGTSIRLGSYWYCGVWAPEIRPSLK